MKKRKVLCAAILAAAISFFAGCEKNTVTWESAGEKSDEETPMQEQTREKDSPETTPTAAQDIVVYICGAVTNPGVYTLKEGDRVVSAIESAGGLSQEADALSVNQAKKLEDGEQIRILTIEEAGQTGASAGVTGDGKVNINRAEAEALMTLPGIGEAKALAIIEYRETNGGFGSIEDIMKIAGIKEAVFSQIKDKIAVN